MAVSPLETHCESPTDIYPLLMEQPENRNNRDHIIDITRDTSSHDGRLNPPQDEIPSSINRAVPNSEHALSSLTSSNSRNSSFIRRGDGRRHRSPLNSGLWILIEVLLTVSQIVASVTVLSLSRDEHPRSPLRAWIVGYATGCVALLPLLYWRYTHRNQGSDQDPAQSRQVSFHGNLPAGSTFSLSVTSGLEEEGRRSNVTATRSNQYPGRFSARIKVLVEYIKMALDCFFAVWFVVGNVWIFGGHASAIDAPNLYRLCIVFLTFSCIGYAMPFILCATICCCLPCIISFLRLQEDLVQTRGATSESINSLPTYKFKLKKNRNGNDRETGSGAGEGGGVIGAGTDKERVISAEDAVCCICLAKYTNNDELRELPCTHFFHKECVDKWLKINALCPLCKCEIPSISNTIQGQVEGGSV